MSLPEKILNRAGFESRAQIARREETFRAEAETREQAFHKEIHGAIVRTQRESARAFAAAQINRLTNDWLAVITSMDMDIRYGGRILRERARDMAKNDDYARKIISEHQTNVVGSTGFKLQMNVKEGKNQDELANSRIEQAWKKWIERESCTVDGRSSFRQVQNMLMEYCVRDGESAIRIVYDAKAFCGMRLEIMPVEALDELYNAVLDNGNVVKMGVELNEWRRPVAYHFRILPQQYDVYGSIQYGLKRIRIPADQLVHGFRQEYINQSRGISWLVQSMIRLRMLQGYEESSAVNARTTAAKMWMFVSKIGEESDYTGPKDDNQNFYMDASPGSMEKLPDGWDVKQLAAEYPTAQHAMFIKSMLRGAASGSGVSYNTLANDLEGVNYSSIRAGVLDEREYYKLTQSWFVDMFLKPIFSKWLESAILAGAVNLPISKFDKFNQPVFVGRRWSWVDPLKDMAAMSLAREIKVQTLTQQLAEQGDELEETLQEFADEEAAAQKLGMSTIVVTKATGMIGSAEGTTDENPPADDNTQETKPAKGSKAIDASKALLRALTILAGEEHNGNGRH